MVSADRAEGMDPSTRRHVGLVTVEAETLIHFCLAIHVLRLGSITNRVISEET